MLYSTKPFICDCDWKELGTKVFVGTVLERGCYSVCSEHRDFDSFEI